MEEVDQNVAKLLPPPFKNYLTQLVDVPQCDFNETDAKWEGKGAA